MWFWQKEKVNDEIESDLSIRIAEIQSRIATLRRSVERSEKSSKIVAPQPEPVVAAATEENFKTTKEQDMMALKAKLLGKKL